MHYSFVCQQTISLLGSNKREERNSYRCNILPISRRTFCNNLSPTMPRLYRCCNKTRFGFFSIIISRPKYDYYPRVPPRPATKRHPLGRQGHQGHLRVEQARIAAASKHDKQEKSIQQLVARQQRLLQLQYCRCYCVPGFNSLKGPPLRQFTGLLDKKDGLKNTNGVHLTRN